MVNTQHNCITQELPAKRRRMSVSFRRSWLMEGLNYSMLNQIKLWCCLFLMALNHSITDAVFFHWLNSDALVILLLILSRIVLLILPISDLLGWISRQVGLLAKFGLWSFSVMKASLLAVMSTLSSMPRFVAMFLFSEWMARVVLGCAFL